MKKLFETLLTGILTLVFSGTIFSNTFAENSLLGTKTEFIQLYEINEISNENTLVGEHNNSNISFLASAGDNKFTELDFDKAILVDQSEILLANGKSNTVAGNSSITIEGEAVASFNAFPNPATEKLFVRFIGWDGIKEIKLIDITGRSVLVFKTDEILNEIDISSFPKGIYLIAAKNELHYEVKKIKIQ
jgi:hypothetical protein